MFKTKILPFIFSISVGAGYYLLTQQIIGSILVSIPTLYLIYMYNQSNAIAGKFLIDSSDVNFVIEDQKGKLYLIIECHNISNQVIQYSANLEKSFIEIKTANSHATLSRDKDNVCAIKQHIYPYSTTNLRYCYFYIDDILKLAKEHNDKVIVHFNIALKYGLWSKKCNFEAFFTDKANLKILLNKEGEIEYKYTCKRSVECALPLNYQHR